MATLGQKIRELRKNNKLTQDELAEKIFVTRTAVSRWERDECYPSLDSLKMIAKEFNVSLDVLLGNTNVEEFDNNDVEVNNSNNNSGNEEPGYTQPKNYWGLLAGITGVITFYLTVAVVVIFLILERIAQETGFHVTLLDEWYQILLFTLMVVFAVCFIGFIVLKIIDRPSVKVIKEKKTFKRVILNRNAWISTSTFFAIAFTIFMVGESIVRVNETSINYGFGINPYVQYSDPNTNIDSEYFKSDFYKEDGSYDDQALREASFEVSRKAAAEGMTLLWNNNNALPLKENSKLSFFGVSCRPYNWAFTGGGSGGIDLNYSKVGNLKSIFESEGKYTINPTLYNSYPNKQVRAKLINPFGDEKRYAEAVINEKDWASVNSAAGSTFASYGDAAVFFMTRWSSEDTDVFFDTSINTKDQNVDNNYLDLTKNEMDTFSALEKLKKDGVFKKIILVLNSGTPINMKTIMNYDFDACLWAGMGGNASLYSLYDVMSGKVNPSGRLPQTYAYDNYSAPSTVNFGRYFFDNPSADIPADDYSVNMYNHNYLVYQEGIYVGYRYYETRYEDTVLGLGNASSDAGIKHSQGEWKYQEEVKFPFGYGLSYTDFKYDAKFEKVDGGFEATVGVTNVGKVPGKTPIQIYIQKPYTDYDKQYGIEKASVELVAYDKTDVIPVGERQEYKIFIDEYEMKSYDSYNKKTYILEKGNYYFAVGRDSHDALNNILARKAKDGIVLDNSKIVDVNGQKTEGDEGLVYKEVVAQDDFTKFAKSSTGYNVTNQFDDVDINLYKGTADQRIKYLSRSDWKQTYPRRNVKLEGKHRILVEDLGFATDIEENPNLKMPLYETVTNEGGELKLIMLKGLEYNNPLWEDLLNQMSWEETIKLCGIGQMSINAVKSVGSPYSVAYDGPCGVKHNGTATEKWDFAFPVGVTLAATFNDDLVEEVFTQFGNEMLHCNVKELYGPGAGINRSAFGGRNWEYFSEDGFLSGKILCREVIGLQSKGAIVNIKHFVLNDQETARCGVATFANEQSLREIYLKAFEEAIVVGHANGVMSALNRIGATWAGRHKGLLTEVLRNEWGFIGIVETDAAAAPYMMSGDTRANAIIAGNDLWLRGSSDATELWGNYKNNPTVAHALRESAHRILYTVCNSAAMNGIDSSTKFIYITPWYYNVIHICQVVTGVALGISLLMIVLGIVLNNKKSTKDSKEQFNIVEAPIEPKVKKKVMITGIVMLTASIISSILIPVIGFAESDIRNKVDTCIHACEVCGGCTDVNSTDSNCNVKCGDSKAYEFIFEATDVKVAKDNCEINKETYDYITSFNKENGSTISYDVSSDEETTVTLIVNISKSIKETVFTDSVIVKINGEQIKTSSIVPSANEEKEFIDVGLGCITLKQGDNRIDFIANGSAEEAYDFKHLKLYSNNLLEFKEATEIEHKCDNVCPTCKGCLDYTCYNPGCTSKCTCQSGGLKATMFNVLNDKCIATVYGTLEKDGIIPAKDKVTKFTYVINAKAAGSIKLGVVVSQGDKDEAFLDRFGLNINGTQITGSSTKMPKGNEVDLHKFSMVVVDTINLEQGRNVITITHAPTDKTQYNFQSMIIFGNSEYSWYVEENTGLCNLCNKCNDVECEEHEEQCECQKTNFDALDGRVGLKSLPNNYAYKRQDQNVIGLTKYGDTVTLTYKINAEANCKANLSFVMSGLPEVHNINKIFTSVKVNSEDIVVDTMIHKGALWFSFDEVFVNEISLKQGENIIDIEFYINSKDYHINFRSMIIQTNNVKVCWADNYRATFYAVDSHTILEHDNPSEPNIIFKNTNQNVISFNKISDTVATLTFNIKAENECTAKLFIHVSALAGLPGEGKINQVFKYISVNGNNLNIDTQVFHDGVMWGDYKDVYIGEVSLNKGKNVFKFAWSIPTKELAFNFRAMVLETSEDCLGWN